MSDQKVSVVSLTEDMRKKIAADLGLSDRLEKVPEKITILGVSSAAVGIRGTVPTVLINM